MTAPALTKKRILVVDDEPFVCEAVKMMLLLDGHQVEVASNAKEGLALLQNSSFDVVITDYYMPDMKGDELAVRIKAHRSDQPVVMITAYAEMLQSAGNPLTGVDSVISKPFLLADLRAALAKVCATAAS